MASKSAAVGLDSAREAWPAIDLEAVSACPVCGETRRRVLHRDLVDWCLGVPGTWALYRCLRCRSGFLDPRPTVASIGRAYEGDYFTHQPCVVASPETLGRWSWIRRFVANSDRNRRYGARLAPAGSAGAWIARLLPSIRRAIDREYRLLPRAPRGGRVLDVGFGAGGFMTKARSLGWAVQGVDPDPIVVARAQELGFEVRRGSIESLAEHESFDRITLSHVIEHCHDPLAVLQRAHHLLRPGGVLWLETPNLDSFGYRIFGRGWVGLDSPRHLMLFTWSSLTDALCASGFTSVRWWPSSEVAFQTFRCSNGSRLGRLRGVAAVAARLWAACRPRESEYITLTATKGRTE